MNTTSNLTAHDLTVINLALQHDLDRLRSKLTANPADDRLSDLRLAREAALGVLATLHRLSPKSAQAYQRVHGSPTTWRYVASAA